MVAPLRIARGVQNKVLEALAMGKRVLASRAVASTFGDSVPAGVLTCGAGSDYARLLAGVFGSSTAFDPEIRDDAKQRFCWQRNLQPVLDKLEHVNASTALVTPVVAP
jgi:hypothetical protein